MDEYIDARFRIIDAANLCIMKRQTALFMLIKGQCKNDDNGLIAEAEKMMTEALEDYAIDIHKINKELEDGGH